MVRQQQKRRKEKKKNEGEREGLKSHNKKDDEKDPKLCYSSSDLPFANLKNASVFDCSYISSTAINLWPHTPISTRGDVKFLFGCTQICSCKYYINMAVCYYSASSHGIWQPNIFESATAVSWTLNYGLRVKTQEENQVNLHTLDI